MFIFINRKISLLPTIAKLAAQQSTASASQFSDTTGGRRIRISLIGVVAEVIWRKVFLPLRNDRKSLFKVVFHQLSTPVSTKSIWNQLDLWYKQNLYLMIWLSSKVKMVTSFSTAQTDASITRYSGTPCPSNGITWLPFFSAIATKLSSYSSCHFRVRFCNPRGSVLLSLVFA